METKGDGVQQKSTHTIYTVLTQTMQTLHLKVMNKHVHSWLCAAPVLVALGNQCAATQIINFQRDNHLFFFLNSNFTQLMFLNSCGLRKPFPPNKVGRKQTGNIVFHTVFWTWLTYIEWRVFLLHVIINVGHPQGLHRRGSYPQQDLGSDQQQVHHVSVGLVGAHIVLRLVGGGVGASIPT